MPSMCPSYYLRCRTSRSGLAGEVLTRFPFAVRRSDPMCSSSTMRWRRLLVLVAAISWLGLSNHCALGLAMMANRGPEELSAHNCCASKVPVQPVPTRKSSLPCCKTLPVVAVAPLEVPAWSATGFQPLAIDLLTTGSKLPRPDLIGHLFADTGPPVNRSFAETVLQRCLLAHAPPCLS